MKPIESNLDEDYEGLLSSYLESDSWKKIMIHEYSKNRHTKIILVNDEEQT